MSHAQLASVFSSVQERIDPSVSPRRFFLLHSIRCKRAVIVKRGRKTEIGEKDFFRVYAQIKKFSDRANVLQTEKCERERDRR